LISPCSESLRLNEKCIDRMAYHLLMLEMILQRASQFDIIHYHIDYIHYALSRRCSTPNITTLHGRLDLPDYLPLYKEYKDVPLVSISNDQRKPIPWANWQSTVYHGLPLDLYKAYERPGDYLAFVGRVSPEKGLDRAIEIAKRAGMRLRIAAKVDSADREYYETVIQPLLDDPSIEFVGEIGESEKNEFLGNAYAFIFPVCWPEPFGMVMIESMACGTPIVAFPRGSVPEVIDEGVTGYMVESVEGAVEALERVSALDRRLCRARFEERFSAGRMARDYMKLYSRLAGSLAVAS
jgi:glycosyltransferase involved in cell wall biosynthesis